MNKLDLLIIGGSGFIGTNLIELLSGNYNIRNIDRRPSLRYNNYTAITDIRDPFLENSITPGCDWVVLLAAEHRDDVSPASLYYDVNVEGTKNVLRAMDSNGIKKIIFTSSVAIYGLNKDNPDINHPADPFNDYGRSKWMAEEALREWYHNDPKNKTLIILRPTVIFGPGNRGNVYNLLTQIAKGRFLMVGTGKNKKSMAYVKNIVSFIQYCIQEKMSGYHIFNYIDKPDLTTGELVKIVESVLKKKILPSFHIPYWLGYFGGLGFDFLSKVTHKEYPISSIRVKKFCSTTQFSSASIETHTHFKAPFTLQQGLTKTIQGIVSGADQPISAGSQ